MSEAEHRSGRHEFALPDVGEGLTEAEIVTWRVAVGDTVNVNDILLDIETAKSVVELPSPYAGVVEAILVAEGRTVPVGTPIITIADLSGSASAASDPDSAAEREPTLVGYGARTSGPRRRRKVPTHVGTVVPLHGGHDDQHARHRVRAKPPVRKLAKDLGVDVADVPASGPFVTRADVEAFAATRPGSGELEADRSAPVGDTLPAERSGELRVPVRGIRKSMAAAMSRSILETPQATVWLTLDVSRTVDLLERLQAQRAFEGVRLTPTAIIAKAVCLALRHRPTLNSRWIESGDGEPELLVHESVNLGVAVATERGLIVPNIKAADQLSLRELAAAIDRLTTTGREGHTQPADQVGGTFTITNIGPLGVDAGTPILNPGESGILAVGAIERRPWIAEDDTVVPRWVTTLALSFDHRVADGAEATQLLTEVADIVRDPATALTY